RSAPRGSGSRLLLCPSVAALSATRRRAGATVAALTAHGPSPLPDGYARDSQRYERIEPPEPNEVVGEQADQHGRGEIRAEEVLTTLAGGRGRAELLAQPELRPTEPRADRQRAGGQPNAEPARVGVVLDHEHAGR